MRLEAFLPLRARCWLLGRVLLLPQSGNVLPLALPSRSPLEISLALAAKAASWLASASKRLLSCAP